MKEFIEKLIGRLEELPTKGIDRYKGGSFGNWEGKDYFIKQNDAIKIVNQLAEEYNNGWIPVEKTLPKKTSNSNKTLAQSLQL